MTVFWWPCKGSWWLCPPPFTSEYVDDVIVLPVDIPVVTKGRTVLCWLVHPTFIVHHLLIHSSCSHYANTSPYSDPYGSISLDLTTRKFTCPLSHIQTGVQVKHFHLIPLCGWLQYGASSHSRSLPHRPRCSALNIPCTYDIKNWDGPIITPWPAGCHANL